MNNTVMHRIFKKFNEDNISYCHFKSNQHLDESFAGKSDFDVLADRNKKNKINIILTENGGKRFESPKINNYPGIENWLVFDEKTGIIYHLHFHYQLLTGTAHVKEYLIPWYKTILDDAELQEESGIYICNPSLELLLLFTRIILKCKWSVRAKLLLGIYKMPKDVKAEYDYLLDRIDRTLFNGYANRFYNKKIAAEFGKCIDEKKINAKSFKKLYKLVRRELAKYRRCSGLKAFVNYFNEGLCEYVSMKRRKKGAFVVSKKVSESGGLAIAFIGTDGSGKSTTSKEIHKWLSKKIECQTLYLGTGDGATDIRIKLLKFFTELGMKLVGKGKASGETSSKSKSSENRPIKKVSLFSNPVKYMSFMIPARIAEITVKTNKKKLIKMNHYRTMGGICIMDRYPQLEKPDMNDGPKIEAFEKKLKGNRIKRMAKRELENMVIVKEIYPDIIFRLNVSLDTCMNRKPQHKDRDYFSKKIADLNELKYEGSLVIDIDAEQPYEQELLEIKKHIWERL